jgi:AcrR family transcriptional regulator
MRVMSEERRQAILDAAAGVFLERGFEQTTMEEVAERLGVSKATVYRYFNSKEALFITTVTKTARYYIEILFKSLSSSGDNIRESLDNFARNYVMITTGQEYISVMRLVYEAARKNDVGKQFYEQSLGIGEGKLVAFIKDANKSGSLKTLSPLVAARHLRGLLACGLPDLCMAGVIKTVDDAQIDFEAKAAVDVFLAAYGS